MSENYCPDCGGTLYGDTGRCVDCGERLAVEQRSAGEPEPMRRLWAVLAGTILFVGGFFVALFVGLPFAAIFGEFVGAPAIVAVVAFLLLALTVPLLSGGVAGYLRGSDLRESALTGALSGLVIALPLGLLSSAFWLLVGGFAGMGSASGSPAMASFTSSLVVSIFFQVAVLGAICAAGGALGSKYSDRPAPGP